MRLRCERSMEHRPIFFSLFTEPSSLPVHRFCCSGAEPSPDNPYPYDIMGPEIVHCCARDAPKIRTYKAYRLLSCTVRSAPLRPFSSSMLQIMDELNSFLTTIPRPSTPGAQSGGQFLKYRAVLPNNGIGQKFVANPSEPTIFWMLLNPGILLPH